MRPILVFLVLLVSVAAFAEIPIAEPGIVPAFGFGRHTPVVVAGDGFLVLWEELRGPLMMRMYEPDGTPRQPLAVQLDPVGRTPHALWTGSEFLVVFARPTPRFPTPAPVPSFFAVRIRPDGTIVEGSRVSFADARVPVGIFAFTRFGQTNAAVVAHDGRSRLIFFDDTGRVTGTGDLMDLPAAIVGVEGGFLFTLSKSEGDAVGRHENTYAVVDNTGVGVIVTLMDSGHDAQSAFILALNGTGARSIAWDGSAWVTAYVENGAICTARFTGVTDIQRSCNQETDATQPFIAARDGRTFKAWLGANGQIVTDGGIASQVLALQVAPAATVDATGLLAVWEEDSVLHLGGFTHDGAPRDVRVVERPNRAGAPRIAAAGSQSLLVWHEADGIHATRIDSSGTPIPPVAHLGEGQWPDVASNGREWIVAWQRGNEVVSTVVSANLDGNGLQPYGAPQTIQYAPVVAATPNGWLLVWSEYESREEGEHSRVVALALNAAGSPVSVGTRVVDRVNAERVEPGTLGIGCSAQRCLVSWSEARTGNLEAIVVGFDAAAASEPRVLAPNAFFADAEVVALPEGLFRVYGGPAVAIVAADGTPLEVRRWAHESTDIGSALFFRGRPAVVYSRGGRVFVDGLERRRRAARH